MRDEKRLFGWAVWAHPKNGSKKEKKTKSNQHPTTSNTTQHSVNKFNGERDKTQRK